MSTDIEFAAASNGNIVSPCSLRYIGYDEFVRIVEDERLHTVNYPTSGGGHFSYDLKSIEAIRQERIDGERRSAKILKSNAKKPETLKNTLYVWNLISGSPLSLEDFSEEAMAKRHSLTTADSLYKECAVPTDQMKRSDVVSITIRREGGGLEAVGILWQPEKVPHLVEETREEHPVANI